MEQERNILLDAINALPEPLQLPFALRFEHGMDCREIAACLHMPLQDATAAINEALELCRPALERFVI